MSLHLLAYDSASSTTANTQIQALPDIVARSNNNFVLNQDMNLYTAQAVGANLQLVRLNTPSSRAVQLPQIRPIQAATMWASPPPVCVYPQSSPFKLKAGEEIRLEGQISTSTTRVYGGLLIGDRITPPPQGPIYCLHGTGTTTAVADTWTTATITWDDSLAAGTYGVVGATFVGTTLIFGRIYVPGQSWRPGCPGVSAYANRVHEIYQKGNLGVWLTFDGRIPPSVEILCTAGDTAQDVFLDIVRIS